MENGEFPTLTGDALEDYQRRMTSPTLADRIASPTLPAEVEKARALLDAKDAGWNEGVEACRKMLVSNGQPGLSSECLNLLIPTVPPTKETT